MSDRSRHEAVEHAARALLVAIAAEGRYRERGREFLAAAAGIDRGSIIHAAAVRIIAACPRASLAEAEAVLWTDMRCIFGWRDVAELEPWGRE